MTDAFKEESYRPSAKALLADTVSLRGHVGNNLNDP
jgi:hypothetical protein